MRQKLDHLIISKTFMVWIIFVCIYFISAYVFSGPDNMNHAFYLIAHFYMCYVLAPTKNRSPWLWGILGLVLGPLAVLFIKVSQQSKDGVW